MAEAQTYTSDLGAAESNITSLAKAYSQGLSGIPAVTAAMRKSLAEREKTLPGLEQENETKIQELYTADKRLAERYSQPGGEMYIENPNERQALISGQKADIRGELGNILNLIQSRSQVLGNAMDKGLEMYKAGLEAQKFELETAEKEWDRIFKKQQAGKEGKDYSAYAALLEALAGEGTMEEMPRYSPTGAKIGTMSAGGQWKYTGKGITGWEQVGGNTKLQKIMEATKTNPEVAAVAFSNWGDIFKEEESQYKTDTRTLDAVINQIIESKKTGRELKPAAFPAMEAELYARAAETGKNIGSAAIPPTGGIFQGAKDWFSKTFGNEQSVTNEAGAGGTAPSPADVSEAQAKIDQYTDPLQRADVYQQIISIAPELTGYISY